MLHLNRSRGWQRKPGSHDQNHLKQRGRRRIEEMRGKREDLGNKREERGSRKGEGKGRI